MKLKTFKDVKLIEMADDIISSQTHENIAKAREFIDAYEALAVEIAVELLRGDEWDRDTYKKALWVTATGNKISAKYNSSVVDMYTASCILYDVRLLKLMDEHHFMFGNQVYISLVGVGDDNRMNGFTFRSMYRLPSDYIETSKAFSHLFKGAVTKVFRSNIPADALYPSVVEIDFVIAHNKPFNLPAHCDISQATTLCYGWLYANEIDFSNLPKDRKVMLPLESHNVTDNPLNSLSKSERHIFANNIRRLYDADCCIHRVTLDHSNAIFDETQRWVEFLNYMDTYTTPTNAQEEYEYTSERDHFIDGGSE